MATITKLNQLRYYPLQKECAKRIVDAINNGSRNLLLIAQSQSGKTETAILTGNQLLLDSTVEQVVYLIHNNQNSLKNQATKRVLKADLEEHIKVISIAQLRGGRGKIRERLDRLGINTQKRTLIVTDECHEALKEGGPLDNFFRLFGVYYGYNQDTWETDKVIVLSKSATPFAHYLKNLISFGTYKVVSLGVSKDYFSMEDLVSSDRFNNIPSYFYRDTENGPKLNSWVKKAIKQFYKQCKKGRKIALIRAFSHDNYLVASLIKDFCMMGPLKNVRILHYDTARGNLSDLPERLQTTPASPTIIFIKNGLSAGITFKPNNIGLIIEPSASRDNVAHYVQKVARSCGYNKSQYDYPVWADLNPILEAIEFWREWETKECAVGGSAWNRPRKPKVRNSDSVMEYHVLEAKERSLAIEEVLLRFPNDSKSRKHEGGKQHGITVRSCANQNVNDVANYIITESNFGSNGIFHVDGPNSENPDYVKRAKHVKSYNRLISLRPEVVGAFIYGRIVKKTNSNNKLPVVKETMLKKRSMLNRRSHPLSD